ncbi:hypothetical protein TH8_07680 [Thalassospira profundimaris]|nr:hypothetical protein TH8_07680 [Thalassospira profundimaris]
MSVKSLGDPFSGDTDLRHSKSCGCDMCASKGGHHHADHDHGVKHDLASMPAHSDMAAKAPESSEEILDRAIDSAIVRSVFGHNEISRRSFAKMVGGSTMMAALASVLPIDKVKAAILDDLGTPEKSKLNIGFVPITCATPIIMAQPMGFYEKYGLDVDVIKTAGWAVARDKSLNNEYDASHMLTPMPLAISMGAGSTATPFPWHSMGVWILTQMKRWGYIEGDIDYKKIAEEVYVATDCAKVMKDLGYEAPTSTYKSYTIMGKTFDPDQPEAYVNSFAIGKGVS